VIGLGVGEAHATALHSHPRCKVEVICDSSPSRLAEVAAEFPSVNVAGDAETVLADPAIDLVVIASYDDCHGAQVMAAIDAGKHVFVEKPLCMSPDETRAIRTALVARPDVRLSSNLILRRSPRFKHVRQMIRDGAFGDLFHVEAAYNYGRLEKLTQGWRGDRPVYSVMLGGGVHMVDLLLWLTEGRVVEVAAFGNRISTRHSKYRFHDLVTAVLRFADGMTATLTANFGCVLPHEHALSVYGTEATFRNDWSGGHLCTTRDPSVAPEPVDLPHPGADKGDLLPAFVDAILDAGEPEIPIDDVFRAVSVCLAVERSSVEREPVAVEYL
jgi:predicted dehydrogenase